MGAHTAALQPADSDSDSDDDDGDDSQSTAATPTTTSTAPHTAADAAADTIPVKCVSWHRATGSRWYPADMRAFARAARTALLLWTRSSITMVMRIFMYI